MTTVTINPVYRALADRLGLCTFSDFAGLPATVISGHPDRNVSEVILGDGSSAISAYLKREHRVPWKDRLRNAMAGFGFVSKSRREAETLAAARSRGLSCPDWIATGADPLGGAFVLLRAIGDCVDLRSYLGSMKNAGRQIRRRLAVRLGAFLADLHAAGVDQPDLYAKHVLVDPSTCSFHVIDWQRSRIRSRLGPRTRWRDLAALHATLPPQMLSSSERLIVLRTYLRHWRLLEKVLPIRPIKAAFQICRRADKLRRRRKIKEMSASMVQPRQALTWLDGEALCVSDCYRAALSGGIPRWLRLAHLPRPEQPFEDCFHALLAGNRLVRVQRARVRRLIGPTWARLRNKHYLSPLMRQAGLLNRLQRAGIPAVKVAAFGQRCPGRLWLESLLVTETPTDGVDALQWLGAASSAFAEAAPIRTRRAVLKELASLIRRLHDIGFHVSRSAWKNTREESTASPVFWLQFGAANITVSLGRADVLVSQGRVGARRGLKSLVHMALALRARGLSRSDVLYCMQGCFAGDKVRSCDLALARAILRSPAGSRESGPATRPGSHADSMNSQSRTHVLVQSGESAT